MSITILCGAKVYTKDFKFEEKSVIIEDGKITYVLDKAEKVTFPDADMVDLTGKFIIPGLIDIHLHGAVGADFCDGNEEAFHKIAKYEASQGIVAICPTTMTLPYDTLENVMKCAQGAVQSQSRDEATIIGINMEGPFVSKEKCGAQNPEYLKNPDIEAFNRLQSVSGDLIRLVDIAPELEGAEDFIRQVAPRCRVSLAHTTADYETASRAFKLGAKHVTHLHNAMPPLLSRAPGLIGAAFDNSDVTPELICDGYHILPAMVRATFKLFGADRMILISDSCMAAGMPAGEYSLGGQPVFMQDRKATLADGTLAGSASNLMDCLQQCIQYMNIPVCDAVRAATYNPAKAMGVLDEFGTIEYGKKADLVILNGDYEMESVILDGVKLV